MSGYNLDMVRQCEGWPLAMSADCKYLACRIEDGFDAIDVESGQFCGDYSFDVSGPIITAAAFSHSGRWVAIGTYDGQVKVFQVEVADGSR